MTSGEYFGDFLIMAPSSQTKEPPQFPGRFRTHQGIAIVTEREVVDRIDARFKT